MKNLAVFLSSLLMLISMDSFAQVPDNISSELVILNVVTGEEKTILKEKRHFEAPNWSRDGDFLLINSGGFLEKVDLNGQKLGRLFPDQITRANNDHGISFDGKLLVISKSEPGKSSQTHLMTKSLLPTKKRTIGLLKNGQSPPTMARERPE